MLIWLNAVYQSVQLQASGASLTPLQQALADTTQVWIPDPWTPPPNSKRMEFAMGLGWQIPTIDSAPALVKDDLTSVGGRSCWVGLTRCVQAVPPVGIAIMTNQVNVPPDHCGHTILQQTVALG